MDPFGILSDLFLIMPELRLDDRVVNAALKKGYITDEDYADWLRVLREGRRFTRIETALRNKTLMQRILILAPEVLSVQTVNMMAGIGLLSTQEAHALRITLRAGGALSATPVSEDTIFARMKAAFSATRSEELINLIRSLDDQQIQAIRQGILIANGRSRLNKYEAAELRELAEISIARAESARAILRGGKVIQEAVEDAKNVRGAWNSATVVMGALFSEDFLKAAIRAGVIDPRMFDTISAIEKLGMNVWRKGVKAFDYDGWFARSLMVSEGILSPEMVSALRQLGLIDGRMADRLYFAADSVRAVTRDQLAQYVSSRKFRVRVNESPLQTYARVANETDRYLLKLLAESANRSSVMAEQMMKTGKFGNATRAAQQRMLAAEMHQEMRRVAENMGAMIIFGEKDTARAAVESMDWLQKRLLGRLSEEDQRALRMSARAGLDSFVSRGENRTVLSRRVYGNLNIWTRRIDHEINIGLLRGLSARELAKSIENLINPNVRGGVSHAAMRLARTELNNAFHFTQIRFTREMPWVDGYQWNLSGSHKSQDVCNDMAHDDHSNMGPGIYSKKSVPGKPHPNCFCFLTMALDSPGQFEKKLLRGSYDRYLQTTRRQGVWDSPYDRAIRSDGSQIWDSLWQETIPQLTAGVGNLAGAFALSALRSGE